MKPHSPNTLAPRQLSVSSIPLASDEIDDETLADYFTDSIMPSKQREGVLQDIDYSLHQNGGSRIPETIAMWWNDAEAGILLLELPDEAESESSTSSCVLLYYLVECHKLIFILDPHSGREPRINCLTCFVHLYRV